MKHLKNKYVGYGCWLGLCLNVYLYSTRKVLYKFLVKSDVFKCKQFIFSVSSVAINGINSVRFRVYVVPLTVLTPKL